MKLSNHLLVVLISLLLGVPPFALANNGREPTVYELERAGHTAFKTENYEEAAEQFNQAAAKAENASLDPAIPRYNQAVALAHLGVQDKAEQYYMEALRTTNLDLQQRAYYNRGLSLMQRTDMEQQSAPDQALKTAEEASAMFEQSITLNPSDIDSKANYELALRKVATLKKLLEEQQDKEKGENSENQDSSDNQGKQDKDQEEQKQEDQDQNNQNQENQDQEDQQNPSEENQSPSESSETEQQPQASEEMTRDEAEMLLDAIREDERTARAQIRVRYGAAKPVEKDW